MTTAWGGVFLTALKILIFRASREELEALGGRHLALGLILTWLVGMGRYWTHPNAHLLQYAGVGSVIYVFALSFLLFITAAGLRARDLQYRKLLTFITLTSPPAALYAIPVMRYWDLATAKEIRLWFLGIVALWRVALYVFYLRRAGGLSFSRILVGTALPIMIIVATLTFLNLDKAVFRIMGGLDVPGTPNDEAYGCLTMITILSVYGILPFLVAYVFLSTTAFSKKPPP